MAHRYYVDDNNPSNVHQMQPLPPQSFSGTSTLDCLRLLDFLSVKQIPDISEGKSLEYNSMLNFSILLKLCLVLRPRQNMIF